MDVVSDFEENKNPILENTERKEEEKYEEEGEKKKHRSHREEKHGKDKKNKHRKKKKKKKKKQDKSPEADVQTTPQQEAYDSESSWESADSEPPPALELEINEEKDGFGSIVEEPPKSKEEELLEEAAREELFWKNEIHRRGRLLFIIPVPLTGRFLAMLNYFLFLIVFLLYVYTGRTTEAFFMRQALDDQFISGEYARGYSFTTITNQHHFFGWVNNLFIPLMYPNTQGSVITSTSGTLLNTTFNSTSNQTSSVTMAPTYLPVANRVIVNNIGYRMGKVRLRQLRVRNDSCAVPEKFEDSLDRCYPKYDSSVEYKGIFEGTEWKSWVENGLTPDAYGVQYKQSYPGSGFDIQLPDNAVSNYQLFEHLHASTWLDFATRAVMLEFNIYNPNVDLVANCVLVMENSASGSLATSSRIRAVPLLKPLRFSDGESTRVEKFAFGWEITMYALVFFRLISLIIDINRISFKRFWNPFFNKLIVIMYLLFVLMACFRIAATLALLSWKEKLESERYLPFGAAAELQQYVDDISAFIALILFVLAFDFFNFNYGLNQFTLTVLKSFTEMFAIMVIIAVLLSGFGFAFLLEFGHGATDYRDFVESVTTLFETTLGVFDLEELRYVNREMGPFLFIFYIVMMIFIVLSMLFAIVNMAYAETRASFALQDGAKIDDPIFNDFCRIYDYIVDILHEKIPITQRFILTYEVMSERAMGKRENVDDLLKGRRAIKALKRHLPDEDNEDDPEQKADTAKKSVRQLRHQLSRGSSIGVDEFHISTQKATNLREKIEEMERVMTGVARPSETILGNVDKLDMEEDVGVGVDGEQRLKDINEELGQKGEYKKTLMRELLLLEKQQRSMMRKIEKLTNMARRDAQDAAVKHGIGKAPITPNTPYVSPPKKKRSPTKSKNKNSIQRQEEPFAAL